MDARSRVGNQAKSVGEVKLESRGILRAAMRVGEPERATIWRRVSIRPRNTSGNFAVRLLGHLGRTALSNKRENRNGLWGLTIKDRELAGSL